MSPTSRRRVAVVGFALLLLGASIADGGQVRVDVNANFSFSPRYINLNAGDHAVWVWLGGTHTVTSGDTLTETPDGTFASGIPLSNVRFSWKSNPVGIHPYYCQPHLISGMIGLVEVHPLATPPTIAVADFRLTEVEFNVAGGLDLIEVTNHGLAAGNLGRFRIATAVGTPIEFPGPTATPNDILVPANGRVVIHPNASGTNTNTDIFILSFVPGTGLPDVNGSLALYVPANQPFQNASSNQNLIIDFVQWGAGGQANELTAAMATFWTAGQFINGVAAGHSIEYCANATLDHGLNRWAEISPPNFGGNSDCTTPVLSESWGRLKIIYRR